MASKRHVEPLDPVIFNKLPRLETEPAATFPTSACKSSSVPNPGSENHFNYKGSYFTCPLQSPDSPEHHPLARWNSAATYLHYSPGSQPVPAEGSLLSCLLYRPEGMGTGLQPPGPEKGKESLMRELLTAQEKWTSPPPALGHPFPVKKPVAVNKTSALAVPKPMYRAPVCFMDHRLALPLGPRAESLQHRPGDADWTLTPAGHPLHPGESRGSGTGLHKRGHHSNPSLLPLNPSLVLPAKEKLGSSVTFSSCYTAFEKYRGPPGTPFLEAGCSATHSQRKVPEVPSLSPDPWSKLQPPTTSPAYQERPAPCYPHTHYPLPLHKATLLYPPPAPAAEAQPGTLPGAYKGFGFTERREPFPGTYLKPQLPRSHFPNPADTYMPRAVTSPPTKSSALIRDNAELPRRAGYLPSPSFAFGPGDAARLGTSSSSSSSSSGVEPGSERHRADSPQHRAAVRHNSAFQPVCNPKKVPGGSSGHPETLPKGEGCWVKLGQGEQQPPHLRRSVSPAPQETPQGTPRAPVIVGKGDACKTKDVAKEVVPPPPSASSPKGLKDPRDREVSPSSPPMPVINNVFSLAPYREYLEGTEDSAQAPFCREHLRGDTPPQNVVESQGSPAFGDVPAGMAAGQAPKVGSGVVQNQGESCYGKVPEKPKLVPQDPGAQECSLDGVGRGEPAPDDIALDLSMKKKLGQARETPRPTDCAKVTPDGEDEKDKEAPGRKEGVGEVAKPQALPLLLEVGFRDKNTFQSSATFMFKKYKILRTLTPRTVPPQQVGSPCAPQLSPTPPTLSSTILLLQPHTSSQPLISPPPPQPVLQPTPSALQGAHPDPQPPPQPVPQPTPSAPQIARPDPQPPPPPDLPRALGEEGVLLPGQCEVPAPRSSAGQYFTTLHTSLCDVISCSVARSSPELLREWVKKAELVEELGEMPKSPPKTKNGSKIPEPQKPTKGKEIWLAFQDVAKLLSNLLSLLETFMFARMCPFPHVVRAGAVFIPIHVVKEKLFPKLPGTSVDQVLQEHKVELRPTTLSEERTLRDLELKSCTSRMLKLLALKQLPDIYPDLLNLLWYDSLRQQLGSSSESGQHPPK